MDEVKTVRMADWVRRHADSARHLLTEGAPFPEAGVNSMRYSVLLGVYSSVLVTVRGQEREVIKGDLDPADPIWEPMQNIENAARVVAFTFAG